MRAVTKAVLGFVIFIILFVYAISDAFANQYCKAEVSDYTKKTSFYKASVINYGNRWEAYYWINQQLNYISSPNLVKYKPEDQILYRISGSIQYSMGVDNFSGYYDVRYYNPPNESVFISCR